MPIYKRVKYYSLNKPYLDIEVIPKKDFCVDYACINYTQPNYSIFNGKYYPWQNTYFNYTGSTSSEVVCGGDYLAFTGITDEGYKGFLMYGVSNDGSFDYWENGIYTDNLVCNQELPPFTGTILTQISIICNDSLKPEENDSLTYDCP